MRAVVTSAGPSTSATVAVSVKPRSGKSTARSTLNVDRRGSLEIAI
jgi:hypothetical protein